MRSQPESLQMPPPQVESDIVTVIVVSGIRLYREGLAKNLRQQADIEVLGTADTADGLIERLSEIPPQIVLFDTALPDVLLTIRAIRRHLPETRIVAVGVDEGEDAILEYAEAGVAGYVLRDGSISSLISTVRSTARGEIPCSPRVVAALFQRVASLAATGASMDNDVRLTNRELEIMGLVENGATNKEIAAQLNIEIATVKNHVHNVLEKLHVASRMHAVEFIRAHQLDYRSEA